jgi:very-short-patch-repair endonuclease
MERDHRINELAARQHSVVTAAQLRELGLSARTVDRRVQQGRLERVHQGVLRIGGSIATREQRALAACLAVGGVVAASHRCAADLWGLELGWDVEPPAELTVRASRAAAPPGVVVHRSVDLAPNDVVRHRGIPVTHPHRLLVDLGAVVPRATVARCLDDLVGRKLVSIAGVRATLDRLAARGRSGAGVLRDELDSRTADEQMSRTRLEALLFALARRCGLPAPVFQFPVEVDGHRRRIDFAFPELMVAIEVDGYESHSRYDVFEDDRVRANELELLGWTVLRFTWHQLRHRPDYVERVLRRAIAMALA